MNFQDSKAPLNKHYLSKVLLFLLPLMVILLFVLSKSNPRIPDVEPTTASSAEAVIDGDLIGLFNSVETKSPNELSRLLLKMEELDSQVVKVIVKTAVVRSIKNPSGPYLRLLNVYKEMAFDFIIEESSNEDNLLPLLQIYGHLYIDFKSRTWSVAADKEKKNFLFSKLLLGLDSPDSELVVVRTFSLGLVHILGDPDSAPYIRTMLKKETWESNISLAMETIRKF